MNHVLEPRWTPASETRTREAGRFRRVAPYALALFLLATAKWGSYLPVGAPPYVADLVIGALLAERAFAMTAARPASVARNAWIVAGALALVVWSAIVLAFGPLTVTAFRDAAPYLYAVLVVLVPAPDPADQSRAGDLIVVALLFHAAWVTLWEAAPGLQHAAPMIGGFPIFGARDDFDGMVCGVTAAVGLQHALIGRRPLVSLVMAAWGGGLVLALGSRAGLLASIVMVGIVVAGAFTRRATRTRARSTVTLTVVGALLVFGPAFLYVGLVQSKSVGRLVGGGGIYLSDSGSGGNSGAVGTARARRDSWAVIVRYLREDPGRTIRGVGFGDNYLRASGAERVLLNTENDEVRSPHNYFVNTWARLGLVGLAIFLFLAVGGLWAAWRVARDNAPLADLDLLAVLLCVGVPIAAALGVVLESPFGAVPYFWALGHLSVRTGRSTLGTRPGATVRRGADSGVRVGRRADAPGPGVAVASLRR